MLTDDPGAVALLDRIASDRGARISVLVEIDTGDRRCGLRAEEAAKLSSKVAASSHLEFGGFQAYKGGAEHATEIGERRLLCDSVFEEVRKAQAELRKLGLSCPTVTGGGTGTCGLLSSNDPLTEIQPGSYVFMDVNYHRLRGEGGRPLSQFEQSLHVLATVMSRGAVDRGMVDAGTKAISLEAGLPAIPDQIGLHYVRGDDEHGRLTFDEQARQLVVGQKIWLIPSNCDPTVNLHDWYVVIQGDEVVDIWPVTARGAIF